MDKIDKPIVKSNKLILAHFKMTTYEQKIILLCISKIKKNARRTGVEKLNDNLFFELGAKEISEFLNISPRTLYKDLDAISSKLMRYEIEIRDNENERFEKIRPFPYSKYEFGRFYLRIEQSMEEHLLELKERFTIYDINNIRMLSSNYSLRIYEVLKSYEWVNEYAFDILEFKQIIGVLTIKNGKVENDLYSRYYDFKKRVLLVAQEEINTFTDITFEFEEIKKGRKVDKLKFYISANERQIENKIEIEEAATSEVGLDEDDLVDQLRGIIKEPLKTKELKVVLQAANNDIQLIENKYQLAKKQKKIENLVGWLVKAIEEDYTEPVEVKKKSKFNNMQERNYDYEDLEKELLGYK